MRPFLANSVSRYDRDTLVQDYINELERMFSRDDPIKCFLLAKLSAMPGLDNSRSVQVRQDVMSRLGSTAGQRASANRSSSEPQSLEFRSTNSFQQFVAEKVPGWAWWNKHASHKLEELHRMAHTRELRERTAHDRLELWINELDSHPEWPVVPDSTTFETLENFAQQSGTETGPPDLQPLCERCRQLIEERTWQMEMMEEQWKDENRDYPIDYQITHLNMRLQRVLE